ncbi:hypothetical protein AQUCO_06500027v1 [Aquilegia coerulea]|uniref:ACT domain-containing protein ACR n=1 Tax=Aquilegia coerulea TaxID=218851 RepID=A0A2G5CC96_AQUCA|nr:hypothetical protein AQUCO_06500027v1 [Aquilegia coerulea]
MGLQNDDVVIIEKSNKERGDDEASVITVNCPDETGLGCDLCRIILDFGLSITKGDVSTDGKWCYVVFWVIPHWNSINVRNKRFTVVVFSLYIISLLKQVLSGQWYVD